MVPPCFTMGSHPQSHPAAYTARTNNACLTPQPTRFLSVRSSKMYSQTVPSCASHLPAAFCMGVPAVTFSFQSLLLSLPDRYAIVFLLFCQHPSSFLSTLTLSRPIGRILSSYPFILRQKLLLPQGNTSLTLSRLIR